MFFRRFPVKSGLGLMEKRITRRDIAQLVGVSGTVVSDVLNRNPAARVSEQTRLRVQEAARRLNYHPNGVARRLVSGRTYTISFAIYDLNTIIYQPWSRLLLGISTAADAHKFAVDLAVTNVGESSHEHFSYRKKIARRSPRASLSMIRSLVMRMFAR